MAAVPDKRSSQGSGPLLRILSAGKCVAINSLPIIRTNSVPYPAMTGVHYHMLHLPKSSE